MISKTMQSELRPSSKAGPRTRVEPANGFPSTAEDHSNAAKGWQEQTMAPSLIS